MTTFEDLGISTKPGQRRYATICPNCNNDRQKHKNALCLTVNDEPDNRWYKCHHCGWSGNLDIADKYNQVREKSRMPKEIPSTYSKAVREYLENERGISQKVALKERIFEFSNYNKPVLGFPFYIGETLVNVKYLNLTWTPESEFPKWYQMNKDLGTRSIFLGMQSIKFEKDGEMSKSRKIIITEGECFHEDTEILTRNGWIYFKNYKGEEVLQVSQSESKQVIGNFVYPEQIIKKEYKGNLIYLHSKNISSLTTEDHNIIVQREGILFKRSAINIYKSKSLSDKLPLVINTINSTSDILNLSNDQIRFCIAVSADMTIRKSGDIYGCFKKRRKKERFEDLIKGLGLRYSCNIDNRGYWSFFIHRNQDLYYLFKEFPIDWIGKLTTSQIKIILEEIIFWDGNNVPNRNQIEYSSCIYNNAKFIQTLAHLNGYSSTIIHRKNNFGSWYKVSILYGKKNASAQLCLKREKIPYEGLVYCVTVPSGMILVRHNEKISISGNCDMLTYKQCGYNNVLSIPMGAPSLEAKNFEHEFDYANDPYVKSFFSPENVDTIIFSGDDDAPGRKCRDHLALIFGRERCKYVNYPVGYKDINEVYWGSKKKGLPKLGKEGVDKCIVDLSTFKVSGVIRPSDVRNELIEYATKGFTPGLGIGVPEVDKLYTLKPKHITMSTGLPGSGKSTYWRWYLSEFVRHNIDLNIKWAMFTPENRPVAREYAKIAEVTTGQAFKEGLPNSMSQSLREATLSFIEKHFFIIAPNKKNFEDWNGKIKPTGVNTMTSLLEYIIYLKKTENIFGYIIDAWNKIEHEQSKYISDTNFISSQLDYLIELNDLYDLHGIVIVHPTKMELVGANFRIPTLYDCKGSSAWKEKADIGVIIHRNKIRKKKKDEIPVGADEDDKYEVNLDAPTILKCEKLRFEELGVEGKIKLSMDYKKGNRFYPVKVEPKPEALKSQTRYDGPQTAETDESFELKPMEDLPF
jgi:hypothetical protein